MASKPATSPTKRPKIPITAPEPDLEPKQDSKAGVKTKPADSSTSKPNKEIKKEKDKPDNKDKDKDKDKDKPKETTRDRNYNRDNRDNRDNRGRHSDSRGGRPRHTSRDRSRNGGRVDRRSRDHSLRQDSSRSHRDVRRSPVRGGNTRNQIVCRDFLRKTCNRGLDCRFYHPNEENTNRGESWFTFCHDYRMGHCNRINCRYFHISRQDEELYRGRGEISGQLVEEAVHKSLMENLTLIGTRPCCKDFLRGMCSMPNCRDRHLTQREYKQEVYNALQEELEVLFGPGQGRPLSPSQNMPFDRFDPMHDPIRPPSPPRMPFMDDMMPRDDFAVRGGMMPDDFESQMKRGRFDGPMFPMEDMREGGQGRPWDERGDFERERLGHPGQPDGVMQEFMNVWNNVNMRRDVDPQVPHVIETQITELKEELNRVMAENSKLHADMIEKATTHEAALKNLSIINGNLSEERRKAQEQIMHLEASNRELRNALDVSVKTASSEKGKMESLQREITTLKDSLTKANGKIRQLESEKSALAAEVLDVSNKLHQATANKIDPFANNMGYNNREAFSRDSSGGSRWDNGKTANHSDQNWGSVRNWIDAGRDRGDNSQADGGGRGRGDRDEFPQRAGANREQFSYRNETSQRDRWDLGQREREGNWKRQEANTWDHRGSSTWDEDMRTLEKLSQTNSRSDMQATKGDSNQGLYNTAGIPRQKDTKSRDVDSRRPMWQSGGEGGAMTGQWQSGKDSGTSGNMNFNYDRREYNTSGYNGAGRNQYNNNNSRHMGNWS